MYYTYQKHTISTQFKNKKSSKNIDYYNKLLAIAFYNNYINDI